MEQKKTEAIILRTKDFGESDLLVTVFSSLLGTLRGVAKGGRKSSKRFVNSLTLFSLVHCTFRGRRTGDLVWFEECELIEGFPAIRSDYHLLSKASYMVELTETLFPSNVKSLEMFQLLKRSLTSLSEKQNSEKTMIMFQARAMKIGGFGINVSQCSICRRRYEGKGRALFHPPNGSIVCLGCEQESAIHPGMNPKTVKALADFQSTDLSLLKNIQCDDDVIAELKRVLMLHIDHRLGKRLKSAHYM
jgi:DNA repair protein RecO (recombination protein O)